MAMRKFLTGIAVASALMVSSPVLAHEHPDTPQTHAETAAPAGHDHDSAVMVTPGMAQDMDHADMMVVAPSKTLPQRLFRWLGTMHPAAVHFPIALFLVAALLEIAALTLRRPVLVQGTRVIVALAAISALVAVALGWIAMGLPGKDDLTHSYHRWLGSSIAVLGLLSWWAKEHWSRRPGRGRELIYIGLLTVTAAAAVINGLFGGMLTHGMNHLRF